MNQLMFSTTPRTGMFTFLHIETDLKTSSVATP
jgi:hypothetical protein